MGEFKDYSNNAWDGMLVFTTSHNREARHIRRQAYATGGYGGGGGGGGGYQTGGHAAVGGHSGGGYNQGPAAVHHNGGYQNHQAAVHGNGGSQHHGGGNCPAGPPVSLWFLKIENPVLFFWKK